MVLRCACLLAVLNFVLCDSAELLVTIEGTDRVEPCIGENITYTCNVSSVAHTWTAPRLLPPNSDLLPGSDEEVTCRYTLRVVSVENGNIISSLRVLSDADFNNTNVTCEGPLDVGVQQIIAVVLGLPSAPMLTATPNGFASFNFTIAPPSVSAMCVLSYTITATPNTTSNIVFDANPDRVIRVTGGGFDLCNYSYNFTVASVAFDGTEVSDTINQVKVDFEDLGTVIIGIKTTPESLIWASVPPLDCFSGYTITTDENSTIQHNTNTNMVTFGELNGSGFSYCINQIITIVPVVGLTGMPITSSQSQGSAQIVITDPAFLALLDTLSKISVNQIGDKITASVSWMANDKVNVTIRRSIPGANLCGIDVTVSGNSSKEVSFDCTDGGKNITFCGQFIYNGCKESKNITITLMQCPSAVSIVPIVVGVVVALIVIGLIIVIIVVVLCCCLSKAKTQDDEHELSGPSYTATPSVAPVYNDGGGAADLYDEVTTTKTRSPGDNLPTYQAPDTIRREAAGEAGGGDMYTVPDKKKNKKNGGAAPAADVADMYSVPDKTKKKQNEGLMYADIDMSRPSKKRSRPPPNQGFVVQEDPGSVTYSTVNH